MVDTIKINRAPVLTLWGVIVAERLGYKHEEALTLGKALAGLNAQSKGRSLGIFSPAEAELEAEISKRTKERQVGKTIMVEVVGRMIPAVQTDQGLRATIKDEEIKPESVERYLEKKFGADLAEVQAALETLAQAYPPQELKQGAYKLYEQFRPGIPEGVRGWGAAGELNLERIRKLANKSQTIYLLACRKIDRMPCGFCEGEIMSQSGIWLHGLYWKRLVLKSCRLWAG